MTVAPIKPTILLMLPIFLFGCLDDDSKTEVKLKAKNIILFIGDGMGTEHRKAARWAVSGKNGMLSMDNMPASGFLETRSADNTITDSAAAATAMATGARTNNGVIAMDANLSIISTILEDVKSDGKLAGLVTTTQVTHSTPAAFASHVEDRNLITEIAEQMLATKLDVLLGGGEDAFLPVSDNGCYPEPGERADGRNLVQEAISLGYTYVCDAASFGLVNPVSTNRLIGLFADEGMTRPYSPSLSTMTKKAIDILSINSEGFFLMVEGGQIDWASHNNHATDVIFDTIALDEAVEVVKQFASKTSDTLIIVTADHETGGMLVSSSSSGRAGEDGPFSTPDGQSFYVNWSTSEHTAANVPVTSQGPRSDMLIGVHDNTYIHKVIHGAL